MRLWKVSIVALLALVGCVVQPESTPTTEALADAPTSVIAMPQFAIELLSPIEILVPADGFQSTTPIVTFQWYWKGDLQKDEHFAVFLWRDGDPPAVVGLTDNRYFYAGEWIRLHGRGPGTFFWKVLVVRTESSGASVALSPDMQPRKLAVSSLYVPTPIVTPVDLMQATPPAIPMEPQTYTVKTVVNNARQVTAFAFAGDGRLFFNERGGRVRVVVNGDLQPEPVLTIPVDIFGERGLIGIAIDPDFEANHYIWISYTSPAPSENGNPVNHVARFVEHDGKGTDLQDALSVPLLKRDASGHQVGNLHFGPDGMLYMAMGDNEKRANAQDPSVIPGKVHRWLPEVPLGIPADNPVPGNSLYALGFRNPWNFAFDPLTSAMFVAENGESCDDEINRIQPGANYGWHPSFECDDDVLLDENYPYAAPLIFFTPPIAPTGIAFYTGDQMPQWRNDLFFCSLLLGDILHLRLDANRTGWQTLTRVDLGDNPCWTGVATGPDGALYYASHNTISAIVPAH